MRNNFFNKKVIITKKKKKITNKCILNVKHWRQKSVHNSKIMCYSMEEMENFEWGSMAPPLTEPRV